MWFLLPSALAAPPPPHPPETRLVADTVTVEGRTAELVVGPCAGTCSVAFAAGGEVAVARFGPGPFEVTDVDHGWIVDGAGPHDTFTFTWEPLSGVAPVPTVLFHVEQGHEHVVDRWKVVALDTPPRVLWEGGSMPRDAGTTEVRALTAGATRQVVLSEWVRRDTLGAPHDEARIRVFRHVAGHAELQPVPDGEVPLYATVFASFRTPAEADAAVAAEPCLGHAWRLDSTGYPALTPGLTVLAKLTPDRDLANRWLQAATACRPDAYVKRAR